LPGDRFADEVVDPHTGGVVLAAHQQAGVACGLRQRSEPTRVTVTSAELSVMRFS